MTDLLPLNEDAEGTLYLAGMSMPDIESNEDVIAEICAADPNQVFQLNWSNASVMMRAGAWAAIFRRDIL